MAWVAMDRMVRDIETFHLPGEVDRWRRIRADIHKEVCEKGFDASRNTFTQYYGSRQLDASLLMIPLVGFLDPNDSRVAGTVKAFEQELLHDGLVMRYSREESDDVDGLPAGEGTSRVLILARRHLRHPRALQRGGDTFSTTSGPSK